MQVSPLCLGSEMIVGKALAGGRRDDVILATKFHVALAVTCAHPAVTAPIIGRRTMAHLQSQLGAAEVTMSDEVLDAIDEIVLPGVTLSRADHGYQPPELEDTSLRRRR